MGGPGGGKMICLCVAQQDSFPKAYVVSLKGS